MSPRSNRFARAAIVAPGLCALLYWVAVQYTATAGLALRREQVQQDEESRQDLFLLEPLDALPADPSLLTDFGAFWSEEAFPPDYEVSKTAATRAILAAPMHSEAWLLLARVLFLERSNDAAKLALSRSDALSPVYTFERFSSLELHELLGDRERVLSVARSIARTHPSNAAKTAELLRSLGIPPSETFKALDVAERDPETMARILEALATEDPKQMAELLALVPEAKLTSEPILARTCLRLAVAGKAYVSLLPLWAALAGEPLASVPGGTALVMADPGLGKDPLQNRSPLGWLLRDEPRRWRASWRPGVISLLYLATTDEADRLSRTNLLQIPVVEKLPPTRWRLRLNSNEPLRSRVSLSVRASGKSFDSPLATLSTEGTTEVFVELPAIEEPTIVGITLVRSREGSARQDGVFVEVSGLEVTAIPEVAE